MSRALCVGSPSRAVRYFAFEAKQWVDGSNSITFLNIEKILGFAFQKNVHVLRVTVLHPVHTRPRPMESCLGRGWGRQLGALEGIEPVWPTGTREARWACALAVPHSLMSREALAQAQGRFPRTQPRCAVRVLTSSPGARAGEAGARFRAWRSCSRYVALRCQDLPAKPGWCFLCAARPDVCSS